MFKAILKVVPNSKEHVGSFLAIIIKFTYLVLQLTNLRFTHLFILLLQPLMSFPQIEYLIINAFDLLIFVALVIITAVIITI